MHARARMLATAAEQITNNKPFHSYNIWDKPVTGLEIGMVILGIFLYMTSIFMLSLFYGSYQANLMRKQNDYVREQEQLRKEKEKQKEEEHARIHNNAD